ncbi:MAG: hypothetical protein H0T05_01355 [Acidobacteria bacterium]|nr:hypothetical protein [Acidobacteriota bacterium]
MSPCCFEFKPGSVQESCLDTSSVSRASIMAELLAVAGAGARDNAYAESAILNFPPDDGIVVVSDAVRSLRML